MDEARFPVPKDPQACVQQVQTRFEKALFEKAKEGASAMRDLMDRADYLDHLKQLHESYLCGDFQLAGAKGQKAIQTLAGMKLLVSLLLGVDESQALKLAKTHQDDVNRLVRLVCKETIGLTDDDMARIELEQLKPTTKG